MSSSSVVRRHEFPQLPVSSDRLRGYSKHAIQAGQAFGGQMDDEDRLGLLEAARREAAEILVSARTDADAIRESAREAGFREGYQTALQTAEEESKSWLLALEGMADQARIDLRAVLRDCEAQVVELSLLIARRVVERELTVNSGAVEAMVRAAVREMADTSVTRVRVSPESHALLAPEWRGDAELVADADLRPGDCLIDARVGLLDGRVESKLNEVAAALFEDRR
jgi:flagellar assembly protein FliH